ncbi:hypothetical protein O0R46_05385 [Peptostreptococcus equinus]|uniref:Uncharacterized protein n=1 Tax=Peptostreptococcus equinus TaxID=3003601 RepID=A0ABY7JNI2_9FIRM|nr:hypothetical protein [Peptostreptococcus sp. CBA3647]WAW14039.1 hypothetical protein O0R46_05385 [Peptostreptococcus sp. CBA3647]
MAIIDNPYIEKVISTYLRAKNSKITINNECERVLWLNSGSKEKTSTNKEIGKFFDIKYIEIDKIKRNINIKNDLKKLAVNFLFIIPTIKIENPIPI